ncbi:MAG: alpha/beta hydrolase [Phycisphaerales bacterium JB040]
MRNRWTSVLACVVVGVLATGALGQASGERRWEGLQRLEKFEDAFELAVREAERDGASWSWALLAARSAGAMGDAEGAGRWVGESAARGYSGIATIEAMREFDGVRGEEAFEVGVEAVRARAAARMDAFKEEASRHEPFVVRTAPAGDGQGAGPILVIALHGTGGTGRPLAESVAASLEGAGVRAVVVGPDGVRSSGSGYAWTFVDEASWFVGHLIERFGEEYGIERQRTVVLGFSQGANVLLEKARTEAGWCAGVVAVCGYVETERDWGVLGEDAERVRVWLVIGQRDPWVRNNRESVGLLEGAGFDVKLEIVARRGHEVPSGALGERVLGAAVLDAANAVVRVERGP